MKDTVLILEGQAVQTLIAAKSLYDSGYEVEAICENKSNYGYHSKYLSKRYVGPSFKDEKAYYDFFFDLVKNHHVDAVLPMADDSAAFLSKYRDEVRKHTKVLIPDYTTFEKGYNKNKLQALCQEKGYPHPETIDLSDEILKDEKVIKFPYPALLKPNFTEGGRGMTRIDDYDALLKIYPEIKAQYGECHLQRFVEPGGHQVEVQCFLDDNHNLLYSSVMSKSRWYPVNGGSSSCNISVRNDKIVEICASVLKDIGWTGFGDFDTIEDPKTGELLILEINPRMPACVKGVVVSGMDYPSIIVDATLGKPLKQYVYKPGKTLRHLGFEMLWFLKSPTRFKTNPSWFKFFGKDIYYQDLSWNDIVPFLCGTWGNIKKLFNPEFSKSKSGLEG